jgi:uncharacterized membrane protein (DUF485 family)
MTKALPHSAESRSAPNRGRGFATFDDPATPLLIDDDGNPDFVAIQQSDEFKLLRHRVRVFVFPATLLFLTWYLTYGVASAYAHDFMSTRVFGVVNVGILLGLAQFVTTIILTLTYARYAKRRLDPQVAVVRELAGIVEE